MATIHETKLRLSIPAELKKVVEDAAVYSGLSVAEFAVSALADKARSVVERHQVTRLSQRDRRRFMAVLDDENAKPNKALAAAAKKQKKRLG